MCPCPRAPYRVPDSKHRGVGFLTAGSTIFLLSYITTSVMGANVIDDADRGTDNPTTLDVDEGASKDRHKKLGRRMMIPLVGPFAAIPHSRSAQNKWLLGISGTIQIASAAAVLVGIVRISRYNRAKRWGLAVAPSPRGGSVGMRVKF